MLAQPTTLRKLSLGFGPFQAGGVHPAERSPVSSRSFQASGKSFGSRVLCPAWKLKVPVAQLANYHSKRNEFPSDTAQVPINVHCFVVADQGVDHPSFAC
jgi:hypothetical protein